MAEPTTTAAASAAATATGLTLFGLATGLDPGALFAALAGALFAIVFQEPMALVKRLFVTVGSAVLAAWTSQAAALAATGMGWWPKTLPAGVVLYPMAAMAGLLMYRVLIPKLIALIERKVDAA